MNVQWYLGRMTKAKRAIKESVKLTDLIIEVVGVYVPFSSRNPDVDELGQNKARIVFLNKSDLLSEQRNSTRAEQFKSQDYHVIKVDFRDGAELRQANSMVQEAYKEEIGHDRRRGILNRPMRAIVVGIPSVGKSVFINSFAGKAYVKTGDKSGMTKGNQQIRLNKNLGLLDTPGILQPRFESQGVGLYLVLIDFISDEILNKGEMAVELLKFVMGNYRPVAEERYWIKGEDPYKALEQITRMCSCLAESGELDVSKTTNPFTDSFRGEKLRRAILEFSPAEEI